MRAEKQRGQLPGDLRGPPDKGKPQDEISRTSGRQQGVGTPAKAGAGEHTGGKHKASVKGPRAGARKGEFV